MPRDETLPKLEIVTEIPDKALVIFAHPDDAEIGSGGVVAKWAAAGCEVTYVLCTNGAAGTADRALTPAALTRKRADEQRAAAGDDIYDRFCRAIERPDLLTDPRFSTSKARSTNRDTIMEVIMPVTRQKTSAEWIKLLNDAGVPCGPIYKINESFADPQVQHLAMAQPVHSPALGDLTILGHPVSHGETRLPLRSAAPELGEANEEVLTSLGYTKEQIADLTKRGVV